MQATGVNQRINHANEDLLSFLSIPVRGYMSLHTVYRVNVLHFIITPSWVLGCTVGGQLVVSPSSSTYPAHALTHIDRPIIRVWSTDTDIGGRWRRDG